MLYINFINNDLICINSNIRLLKTALQINLLSIVVLVVSVMTVFLFAQTSVADIYIYKDKNGVKHFTNVPNDSKYKLFIPERSGRIYYSGTGGYKRVPARAINTKAFDSIIEKASIRYGLDGALIKAVISAESAFNSQAVSPKGAKGLMQIMPENYGHLNISDPFNPAQNIMGGAKYLRQMLQVHDGKLQLALAAYNAGPEAVRKYEGIPPYNETRNYVFKVMNLYNQYRNM